MGLELTTQQSREVFITTKVAWNMMNNRRWNGLMPTIQDIALEGRDNPLNPEPKEIFQEMHDLVSLPSGIPEELRWTNTPWHTKSSIGLNDFLTTVMTHYDYHNYPISSHLFPAPEGKQFIESVVGNSKEQKDTLSIVDQFKIALEIADNHPTAAALVAHCGSRAIARNQDKTVDPLLQFTPEQMREWAGSISRFSDRFYSDILGDNYHFWAYCAAGMLIGSQKVQSDSLSVKMYEQFFRHGADALKISRNLTTLGKKKLIYGHKQVGRMGFAIGMKLADTKSE